LTYWFSAKPRLASITPGRPGLFRLLIERTFLVGASSTVFHVGIVVALLTGAMMEILFQTGSAGLLHGWGGTITWAHSIFGLATAIGFVGIVARFIKNPFFRLASGRMAYVDGTFMVVVSVTGLLLLGELTGILAAEPSWLAPIHLVCAIAWLIVSLFGGGLVAHAVATVVYRFSEADSPAAFRAFSSACASCGKCVEVCPLYAASGGRPEESPARKVRHYLTVFRKGAPAATLKAMAEEIYACALCGLCVAVCPYSFRHYDLYMALLEHVNKKVAGRAA
jgi:ferredoxin